MDDCLAEMPIAEYSEFVGEFLKSFDRLAFALGGMELIRICKAEINFHIDRGAPIEQAIADVYQHIKRQYGV